MLAIDYKLVEFTWLFTHLRSSAVTWTHRVFFGTIAYTPLAGDSPVILPILCFFLGPNSLSRSGFQDIGNRIILYYRNIFSSISRWVLAEKELSCKETNLKTLAWPYVGKYPNVAQRESGLYVDRVVSATIKITPLEQSANVERKKTKLHPNSTFMKTEVQNWVVATIWKDKKTKICHWHKHQTYNENKCKCTLICLCEPGETDCYQQYESEDDEYDEVKSCVWIWIWIWMKMMIWNFNGGSLMESVFGLIFETRQKRAMVTDIAVRSC